jgi:hypothetical protein
MDSRFRSYTATKRSQSSGMPYARSGIYNRHEESVHFHTAARALQEKMVSRTIVRHTNLAAKKRRHSDKRKLPACVTTTRRLFESTREVKCEKGRSRIDAYCDGDRYMARPSSRSLRSFRLPCYRNGRGDIITFLSDRKALAAHCGSESLSSFTIRFSRAANSIEEL